MSIGAPWIARGASFDDLNRCFDALSPDTVNHFARVNRRTDEVISRLIESRGNLAVAVTAYYGLKSRPRTQ
jgi:hypothetical protein